MHHLRIRCRRCPPCRFRAIPLRSYVMAEYVAKRDPKRCPTHPGELLREDVIPATGKTRSEIAALLGISRQHLYDILEERKPVSRSEEHTSELQSHSDLVCRL